MAGVAGGIFFGALMGPLLAAQNRRALNAMDPLPLDQRRAALRAASRGPAPTDPAVREAAAHLVADRLATANRQRKPMTIFFSAFLVLEMVSAILGNPWLCLAVAGIAAMIVVVRRNPVWLGRRLARLQLAE